MGRFAQFLAEVNYHGPSRVITNRGGCVRGVLWLIVSILIWTLLIYALVTTIKLYLSYPIKTHTDVSRASVGRFPAVTICNMADIPSNAAAKKSNETQRYYISKEGYQFQDLIKTCRWQPSDDGDIIGRNCTRALDIIQSQHFPYGNCYTFNSAQSPMPFSETLDGEDSAAEGERKDGRDGGEWYDKVNNGGKGFVTQTGIGGGLTLTLHVASTYGTPKVAYANALPQLIPDGSSGLMVMLHDPNTPPDVRDGQAIHIPITNPQRWDVAITGTSAFSLLPKPYGECSGAHKRGGPAMFRLPKSMNALFDSEEREGDESAGCISKCLKEKVMEENNCTLYDLANGEGTEHTCLQATAAGNNKHDLTDTKKNIDTEASATVDRKLGACRRKCPQQCSYMRYESKLMKNTPRGAATINIYFSRFEWEATRQVPLYSLHVLMRDIGLLFVLWAGFSFVSFMHLVEYILDAICLCCCSKNRDVGEDENVP